jgi:transposase
MLQRGGEVVIRMLENVKQVTIAPLIQRTIAQGSVVYTDEYDIYSRLDDWGYDHVTVCHAAGEFARDATTVTGSARCMSTPWRDSGRCCGVGCVPIGGSRRRSCPCTGGSSSSCITFGRVAKHCWGS